MSAVQNGFESISCLFRASRIAKVYRYLICTIKIKHCDDDAGNDDDDVDDYYDDDDDDDEDDHADDDNHGDYNADAYC